MSDYASCCVLSFNRLNLLVPTLQSMAKADHPYELIVHDDGSTDPALWNFLVKQVSQGAISTLILNPPGVNQGQGTALNRMFNAASGDPIIKIDHDLIFAPGWLWHVHHLLDSNRKLAEEGHEWEIGLLGLLHYYHEPVDSRNTICGPGGGGWSEHTHILGSAFAMTRKSWETFGPFEEHSTAFAEDNAMQVKVHNSHMACALPTGEHDEPLDLCSNVGMGYGPSTVNVEPGVTASIHDRPHLLHGP